MRITGGCQCGAIRYQADSLGRASICHCRMCQKAFGGFFGPLVSANNVVWTRGKPKHFYSSNRNWRGFCDNCGTPMSYEFDGGIELAIGTLDDPSIAPPQVQVNLPDRCSATIGLFELPEVEPMKLDDNAEWNAGVISNQHPDHETKEWPKQ